MVWFISRWNGDLDRSRLREVLADPTVLDHDVLEPDDTRMDDQPAPRTDNSPAVTSSRSAS